MHRRIGAARFIRRNVLQVIVAAVVGFATFVVVAFAWGYEEYYGNYSIGGGNSYIETSGAHTFVNNGGQIYTNGSVDRTLYIACQLFQKSGSYNVVDHGYGICGVNASGSVYVWARVYNQSGATRVVSGYAHTS
jgi:hypothetical protein